MRAPPTERHGCVMWKELARIARRHCGVITTRQAEACGISARTLQRRAAREGWIRLGRGVYLLPGHAVTDHVRMWAAVAAVASAHGTDDQTPPLVAVTGLAAAWLRGYAPRPRGRLEVVLPHGNVAPTVPGIRFIRSRTLRPDDIGAIDALPVATLARLAIDLAPLTTAADLRGLLIDARQQRGDIDAVIKRVLDSTIFPGRRRLRQVLSEIAGDRVDSVFAYLVGEWLRSHGFNPVPEYPIETPTGLVHADHALVDDQIVIECEGFGAHSRRSSLNTDAKRSNGLALRPDWCVLRMTWDRWEHERDDFLAEIRSAQETQRRLLRALAAAQPTSSG